MTKGLHFIFFFCNVKHVSFHAGCTQSKTNALHLSYTAINFSITFRGQIESHSLFFNISISLPGGDTNSLSLSGGGGGTLYSFKVLQFPPDL
jgi:hypothetical protein